MLFWAHCCCTLAWSSFDRPSFTCCTGGHERVQALTVKDKRSRARPVKTRTTAVIIFCALVCGDLSRGQQPPSAPAPGSPAPRLPALRAGYAFPQKQTLTYSVDWRVFSAGTAVVHFEAN